MRSHLFLFSHFRHLCIAACIMLSSFALHAQVTGNAFLLGQTDHRDIEVSFDPISPTGQADTVLTDSTGAFSITLQPAVYRVKYAKTGYNDELYPGSNGILLSNTEVLPNITLNDLTFKRISGNVSDTLYKDTIYIATGNLTVAANSHIYFQAGTQLRFDGNFSLLCYGKFEAMGTAIDPILITSNLSNPQFRDWEGIEIIGSSDTAKMQYCIVEYGDQAIEVDDSRYFLGTNNVIRENSRGIRVQGRTSMTFAENDLYNNKDVCMVTACTTNTYLQIYCNYFHDTPRDGLHVASNYGDIDVYGNTFFNITGLYYGALNVVSNEGNALVEDNAMINCMAGLRILRADSTTGDFIAQHNVISGNGVGIVLRAGDGGAIIQNNAIFDNVGQQIYQLYPPGGTPDLIAYNYVSGPDPYFQVNITGLGTNIINNANGDPADAYLNVSSGGGVNANFNLFPAGTSSWIDAGDPNLPLDPDGSTADIGIRLSNFCVTPFLGYNTRVYPGDADNNQVANVWDLLPIGQHFGMQGAVRPDASLSWTPQISADWGTLLPNGQDIKFADCDGNGVIHTADTAAILQNYAASHNGAGRSSSSGVPLYFLTPTQSNNPSDTVRIPIHLGTVDTPALAMYGLAFAVSYDTSLVKPTGVWVEFDSSWLGTLSTDMITLQQNLFVDGQIDLALTRTDQMDRNGYGKIADLIVVLDEDISKRILPLDLAFVDVVSQDHAGAIIPTAGIPNSISIDTDSTGGGNNTSIDIDWQSSVEIYPNPASDQVFIEAKDIRIHSLRIMNLSGQLIQIQQFDNTTRAQLAVGQLPAGIYLLALATDKGQMYQKLVIE